MARDGESIASAPARVSAGTCESIGTVLEDLVAVELPSTRRATTAACVRRAAIDVPRALSRTARWSRIPANGIGTRLEGVATCDAHREKISADSDPGPRVSADEPAGADA